MTDEDVAADPYDGKTNAELKDELRSRGLSTAGNKDELLDRLADSDTAPEDLTKAKLAERAAALGVEDFPAHGSKQGMIDAINAADAQGDEEGDVEERAETDLSGPNHLPEQADVSAANPDTSRFGLIDTHRDPDGNALTDGPFEPADVAGKGSDGSYDEFDARARAQVAARAADARALGVVTDEGGPKSMADIDGSPSNADFDPDEFPEGGFHESSLPVGDRREAELARWIEANPGASVIPPALLPATFQDPSISTPGLPGESIG